MFFTLTKFQSGLKITPLKKRIGIFMKDYSLCNTPDFVLRLVENKISHFKSLKLGQLSYKNLNF